MIFKETGLKGAFLIEIEKRVDERRFFTVYSAKKNFEKHGLALPLQTHGRKSVDEVGSAEGTHQVL